MLKRTLGIILTLCILAVSCFSGMSLMAAETNHGLYIDTTACTDHSTIVLTQAVYNQPTGNYTVEFDYYTEESGAKSRLNIRTSGNVGESAADLYSTTFKQGEWLTYSSTIQNQKNTAIMIKLYVWPGFKGYIDNIVLKDSNGAVSLELDFDAKTTTVHEIGQDKNATAEVKECPTIGGTETPSQKISGYKLVFAGGSEQMFATKAIVRTEKIGISFDYYLVSGSAFVDVRNGKAMDGAYKKVLSPGQGSVSVEAPSNTNADSWRIVSSEATELYIYNVKVTADGSEVAFEKRDDRTTCQFTAVDAIPLPGGGEAPAGNHGLYIDTTACSSWTTIVLDKAVYEQPVGSYIIEYDYYTEAFGAKSRISIRSSGNVGEYIDEVNATKFKTGEWLHQASTIVNQNTAIQLKLYIWPGFKGYVDNIVLKDSNGAVSMKLDFEENTTNIASVGGVAGMVAKITGCPINENVTPEPTPTPDNNKGLYIDTTACSDHSTITLAKAIYEQPVGKYTVEFDYYTVEFGAKSRLNIRTSGNVGEYAAELYSTSFKKNELLKYSSTIENQNTAIQLKLYVWPGFKGYIDNIVLKDSEGKVAMTLDFDENTTTVDKIGQDKNAVTKIEGRPDTAATGKNHGLYINTLDCKNHASLVLAKAIYDQPVGEYTIDFDYYTLASGDKSRLSARVGGNVGEYAGNYDATGFKKKAWLHYTSVVYNQNTATQIKFYMWPGFEGYIDNITLKNSDGTVVMTIDFDQNNTTILTKADDSKLVAEIKEAPAYVKDESGDQGNKEEELVGGPYMLKQENYKFREELGGTLSYQAFAQQVGKYRNGNEIKPSTKYVFSMDYYCFPGENGTGVASSTVNIRTLHTGLNSTFPNANMDMIYDKGAGRYKGVLLENVGRQNFELEFETLPEQTDIMIMLQSGWDGDAYIWNMKLVEKGGNGENLLKRTEFVGRFDQNTVDFNMPTADGSLWKVSDGSSDGLGTYSFVDFDEAIANLAIGEVLPEEGEEDEEVEGPAINVQDPNEEANTNNDDNDDNNGKNNGLPVLVIVIIIVAGAVLLIGGGILAFVLIKKAKK